MTELSPSRQKVLAADFPDDVAARPALVALGLSHSSISRLCRQSGPWRRPIPGVIVLTDREPTFRQLLRAALTHAGPRAMLTGVQAARLHGVRKLPAEPRVHALIDHRSKVATWGFAVVERTIHLPEAVDLGGLPVAPLARALIDAARRMDSLGAVRAMITDAVRRGLCDPLDLRRELAQASTIGSALPRAVVHEIGEGICDAAEQWLQALLEGSGLPVPERHATLADEHGNDLGEVDVWWSDVGLALQLATEEIDVEESGRDDLDQLARTGVVVIHVRPLALRDEPLTVLRELRAAYERAAQRPPPTVASRRRRRAA